MLRNYMGIINLEESEKNIRSLTKFRPLATVPVAGRYRMIDFVMSGMVNAGIKLVSVFANKATRSLPDHIGNGKPWDLDRKTDGLFLFNNNLLGGSVDRDGGSGYASHIEFLNKANCDNVIVCSSYMVCNIDLEVVGEYFEESGADIVAVYKKINNGETAFLNCDAYKMDQNNLIKSAYKNIGIENDLNISMEMFVMKKKTLSEILYKAVSDGVSKNFKKYLYENMSGYTVKGFEFTGYLSCVNSIDSYYRTNMNMLELNVLGELFNKKAPVYTKTKDSPPTQYVAGSNVKHSIVADGTIIKGEVTNSIISRSVVIEEDVKIDGCIILQNAVVKKGSNLTNVIVDKGVVVDANTFVNCPLQYPLVLEKKKY